MQTALAMSPISQLSQQQPDRENNHITIGVGQTSIVNPRRTPGANLMDSFAATDEDGNTHIYKFRNELGEAFVPRLPFVLRRNHPFFKENLTAFLIYKKFYRPQMTIFDPEAENKKELDLDALELEARNLVYQYQKENRVETLMDMLRRLEGPFPDTTLEQVVLRLSRIAKSEPQRIMALTNDPDFEVKVIIDKALACVPPRLVLQDGRYFKLPNSDTLIADGLPAMVLKVKTDAGFKSWIQNAVVPTQLLTDAPAPVSTDVNNIDFKVGATPELAGLSQSDISLPDREPSMSDERLKALIQAGMDSGLFDKATSGAYLILGQKSVFTVDEAFALYRPLDSDIKALESDLKAYGITV
jgi:hypothetical protein